MTFPISLRSAAVAANPITVDRESGVIYGVSVIVAGPTRTSGGGHGPMLVDQTTLDQVAKGINASGVGVKCRISHPELDGTDDLLVRVGYIRNARTTPRAVLADFHAHDADNTHVRALMDIAENDPGSCGVSIVSSLATLEPNGGEHLVLRVPSIDAADFVGEPAANPAGMLAMSAGNASIHLTGTTNMPAISHKGPDSATAYTDTQDALLIRLGVPLIAFDDNRKVMLDAVGNPRTRKPSRRAMSLSSDPLTDIGSMYLRQVGPELLGIHLGKMARSTVAGMLMRRTELSRYFPTLPMTNRITLSGARGDFPDLLADTLNKAVLSHYALARRSWRAWAKKGTVNDFKRAERVRIEDAPMLELTREGESIEFSVLADNPSETFALATYARGLRYTREALLNDDAEALKSIALILSQGAYRLEDRLAYGILTANGNTADGSALFSTAHGNLTTGVLTNASLGAASALISGRTNASGEVLDLQPEVLVVPTTLKHTAEALLESLANAPRHETEARLSVVSSPDLDAVSQTQWYMGTNPARMAAVEMNFLTNHEEPRIDTASHFDSDGMSFKIVHDVAAVAVDPRLMVRSSGS